MAEESELEGILENVSPNIRDALIGMYNLLKGQMENASQKYYNTVETIKKYRENIRKQKEQGNIGVDSPPLQHYLKALDYKKHLNATLKAVYSSLESFKEWEIKYAKPLGMIGRFNSMRELRKEKHKLGDLLKYSRTAIPAVLLIASFFLLGFSANNMTGFAIAGNNIPSSYPIGAGFALLIIAFCLSFLRKKNKKQAGKPARKKPKGRNKR